MIFRKVWLGLGIGILCIAMVSCQNGTDEAATEQFVDVDDGFVRYRTIMTPEFETISPDGLVVEPDLEEGQGIAMPGPLLWVEDQYFTFVSVFNVDQGPNAIYTATSEDGVVWQRSEEPIVMDPPGTGSFYLASDVLQDHEGIWHLFLSTNLNGPAYSNEFSIWQATAPALEGPWTVGEAALLEPGEPDTWDQAAVLLPVVVETDFGYLMYYHGSNNIEQFFTTSVGMAVSIDGDDWVRGIPGGMDSPYPEFENVIISQLDPDWGDVGVRDIWRTPSGWQMLYFQYFGQQQFPQLRLGTSTDGVDWEPMEEPVTFTLSGMGFFPGVVDASFLPRDDGYDLLIGGFFASSSQEMFFMTQIRFDDQE